MEKKIGKFVKYPGIVTILLHFCQFSSTLKCHECTDIEGFEAFESGCSRSKSDSSLKDGFAGCLKIDIVSEVAGEFVIRAGYYNSQVIGRPLSCYHAEPGFVVHAYIEKIKFATLVSCLACDNEDGCNGTSVQAKPNQLLLWVLLGSSLVNSAFLPDLLT